MARLNALMSWFCCCLGVALLVVSSLVMPEGVLADTGSPDGSTFDCTKCKCKPPTDLTCQGMGDGGKCGMLCTCDGTIGNCY